MPTDNDGNTLNQQGRLIERDGENRPLDPNGQVLPKNEQGDWVCLALFFNIKTQCPPFDQFGYFENGLKTQNFSCKGKVGFKVDTVLPKISPMFLRKIAFVRCFQIPYFFSN